MEKGLEIAFQTVEGMDEDLVQALAALTAENFSGKFDISYRIFLVTLGDQKYFRILFKSDSLTSEHVFNRKLVRKKFDEIAHMSYNDVMSRFKDLKKDNKVEDVPIKEVKEEYDLWEDPLWKYI